MKTSIEFTQKELDYLSNVAAMHQFQINTSILKCHRRLKSSRLSQKGRDRILNSIQILEGSRDKAQQFRDFLSEAKRNFYTKQAQSCSAEVAYISQVNEILADQGLMPAQYFSREGISLRLTDKHRNN
jgi:hypothetical protein